VRQSTLSRSIRDLESKLGIALFERSNGGTRPTPAGQDFLASAKRILESTENLISDFQTAHSSRVNALTVGICTSLAAGNVKATISDYHREFPGVHIRLVDGSGMHLLSDVNSQAVDIAFVFDNLGRWPHRSLAVWSERIIVAIPESHKLCLNGEIKWSQLQGEAVHFSTRGPSPEIHDIAISKIGPADSFDLHRHDAGLDRLLAIVGLGFGVLPVLESAAGLNCPGVVFREVEDEFGPTFVRFRAIWREDNANPNLHSLLQLIYRRYPDLSGAIA
jgi:DNA-binding transcriptional LysR family regulator